MRSRPAKEEPQGRRTWYECLKSDNSQADDCPPRHKNFSACDVTDDCVLLTAGMNWGGDFNRIIGRMKREKKNDADRNRSKDDGRECK